MNIDQAEYNRLLGYPRNHELTGRAKELSDWARAWYSEHGRPWTYSREAQWPSDRFNSPRLARMLVDAESHGVVVAAISAGPELEAEAHRLWLEEKPDEYFFLEMYGSVVVEHLVMTTGARLCDWAEKQCMSVLPHYSPGYPEWDISDQGRLLELIQPPDRLEVLESGALRPKKSLLAVFGLTRHRPQESLIPCRNCSYAPCQYRRSPHVGQDSILRPVSNRPYSVNPKALSRWTRERLTLTPQPDGSTEALFRYDGSTCTNTGRPLTFHYRVTVGPRESGYPIREQHCVPAPGDTGHTYMCEYIRNDGALITAIENEKPLLGRPLDEVLAWRRADSLTACYCDAGSREHKWGLVLETIHYALEKQS